MAKVNLMVEVDKMREYARKGFPEGGEPFIHSAPVLFARIEELERALAPFARKGIQDNEGLPLVQVYHADCVNAYHTISSRFSAPPTAPEEYYPAEHV